MVSARIAASCSTFGAKLVSCGCKRCLSNPSPAEDERTVAAPSVSLPPGATPFVDDLIPAVTTQTPAPVPGVDDDWASLGFGAAAPALRPTPVPAPAPARGAAPPTAQDYLTQLKQQQDAALLMQSNPRDQAYYEAQVATPPPVVRLVVPHILFLPLPHSTANLAIVDAHVSRSQFSWRAIHRR